MVALFVAMMFIGFVMLDVVVQKLEARQVSRAAAREALAARGTYQEWVSVPAGVLLSAGHSWAMPLQEGMVRAGADSLVANALGAVSRVRLPAVGDQVEAGKPLFEVELRGRKLAMSSPVTGRVSSVNEEVRRRPELIAHDPYGKGWVCSLEASVPPGLLQAGAKAATWLQGEVRRLQEFLVLGSELALGATSQDGGTLLPGALAQFEAEVWTAFARDFLDRK